MSKKSWNCWALFVVTTKYPSRVGSIEGTSIVLPVPVISGHPAKEANTEGYVTMVTAMQSSIATSTSSPWPLRRASRSAAIAPKAA